MEENKHMNYQQAIQYIEGRKGLGYSMGLEHIRLLCSKLGNPQEQLKFIHVAGTNGKGSVSAYLTSVLLENGYRVGTYSSPAVFSYEEKMRFQGKPIAKTLLAKLMTKVSIAVAEMEAEGVVPSMFEVETAVAFCFFLHKKCDLVVLEAGLGGLEDATNVITNTEIAVLTSISRDHMGFLGDTLAEIAENKAAIIKPGCYAVTMEQEKEALDVICKEAEQKKVPLFVAKQSEARQIKYGLKKQSFSYHENKKMEISLLGTYQIENAVLALEVIHALKEKGYQFADDKIRKGFLQTKWMGRFSLIAQKPDFVIDGAHNADAARKLADAIEFYFTNKRIVYIMGMLKDKECEEIIRQTYKYADHIITIATPEKERTMSAIDLAQLVKKYHPSVTAADSMEEAVEMSYLLTKPEDVIIAFGSLSYLGKLVGIVNNRDKLGSDSHGKSEKN